MATDIGRVTAVKDKDVTLLTGDDEVKGRWLDYFDDLLNIENERDDLEGILPVQGPIEEIYLEEVITQMGKMKKNKACGLDCLPIEVAKALGDEGAIWMTGALNEAMRKGIPEEWRTSTITHIYKQKGDPLECNKFRGIKLLSHTLKLWERVVESRLRKMVNISERQYGFQPGKSTIQQLFCLRMLQEKQRVWKGAACGVCGPGKGIRQGAKGANMVLAQTKRCSRGLHKHNPEHVCWVQGKRHDQCGKDQRD